MLPLMLTGVNYGLLSLERLTKVFSLNPAKIYGFYPKKGIIQPGADADIILVDMKHEWTITSDNQYSKAGWTPYEGYPVKGLPYLTMVRGKILMEEGEIIGHPGFGEFLPRHAAPPDPFEL